MLFDSILIDDIVLFCENFMLYLCKFFFKLGVERLDRECMSCFGVINGRKFLVMLIDFVVCK